MSFKESVNFTRIVKFISRKLCIFSYHPFNICEIMKCLSSHSWHWYYLSFLSLSLSLLFFPGYSFPQLWGKGWVNKYYCLLILSGTILGCILQLLRVSLTKLSPVAQSSSCIFCWPPFSVSPSPLPHWCLYIVVF